MSRRSRSAVCGSGWSEAALPDLAVEHEKGPVSTGALTPVVFRLYSASPTNRTIGHCQWYHPHRSDQIHPPQSFRRLESGL